MHSAACIRLACAERSMPCLFTHSPHCPFILSGCYCCNSFWCRALEHASEALGFPTRNTTRCSRTSKHFDTGSIPHRTHEAPSKCKLLSAANSFNHRLVRDRTGHLLTPVSRGAKRGGREAQWPPTAQTATGTHVACTLVALACMNVCLCVCR